jgi:predicted transcriptional regulator/ribosome-associated translation inhibitor RaiA
MKISNITVGKIVRQVKPISKSTPLSKIVARICQEKLYAIPVFERGKLVGVITANQLIRHTLPAQTKAEHIMFTPPVVQADMAVTEASKPILDAGAAAVYQDTDFLGIATVKDILSAGASADELGDMRVEEYMARPILIQHDKGLGRARALMRENDVLKLPVVDEEGKLTGVIDVLDVLMEIKPQASIGWFDVGGDLLQKYRLPVLMDKNPPIIEKEGSIKDAAALMLRRRKTYCVVVENGGPIGIITPKDIAEIVAALAKRRGVYVQLAGLPKLDEATRIRANEFIDNTVRKFADIFKLDHLFVHIKEHKVRGRKKFSVHARARTTAGMYVSRAWNWNLLTAMDEAMEKLEHEFLSDKDRWLTERKPRAPG